MNIHMFGRNNSETREKRSEAPLAFVSEKTRHGQTILAISSWSIKDMHSYFECGKLFYKCLHFSLDALILLAMLK